METFSVQAYLKATDNSFVSTFKDAAKQVQTFQKDTSSTMSAVGQVTKGTGKTLTKTVTTPIVGLGVVAAKIGGDFEAQMSRVKAISGATGSSFDDLRQQAIDLGAKTAFSAKESAAGMENLASAGFDSKEIMVAMPGLLDLAAVSGGDVALASENAATALRGFNLDASQSGHVANVFARAAADTNAEVGDMGYAMKYIAPVANSMGLSLEETAAAIGIMSDAGIKGSQAGTTLRGALSRLAKPTKPMIGVMNKLGLSFYDSSGKMKPLKDQIGMLQNAFKDLTPEQKQNALVTLYGQESLSGMMALIDKGPNKLGSLTKSLKNSDGAADKMARTMQDNMNSSLEQMMGAFESAAIVIQKILAPAVRKVADFISGLVQKFVSAPEPVQKLIVVIGLIVASIGPLLLIFGQTVIMLQKAKIGFMALSGGLKLIGSSIGAISYQVILIGLVIAALVLTGYLLYKNWDKIMKFGKEVWGNISKFATNAVDAIKEKWGDITQWFSDTWNNLKNGAIGLWDGTIQGAKDAVDSVKNAWNGVKEWFANLWNGTISGLASAWQTVTTTLAPFVESIKNVFQPMIEFFTGLWSQISTIFGAAWELIKTVVMGPVLLLIDLVTGNFTQLKNDAIMLWNTLTNSIKTIVSTFVQIVVGFYSAFGQTVSNIWTTLVNTVKNLWDSFTTWVINMAKSIVDGIVNGWNSLKQGTVDLWNATVQLVKNTWAAFKQWVIDSANGIVDGVKQGWENLKQGTIDLWNGMINGLKGIWDGLKKSVRDLIDNVKNIFNNLKDVNLLDIGKAIIDGFVKGLKQKWKEGMKFISGIGDWIREHKGPIRKDRKLLTPAGNAIMNGLNSGLTGGFRDVQSNVSGMGDMIANAINSDYSVDIGANVAAANRSISSQVSHDVNLNQGKQPALFNVKLGNQNFKAFVDDISNAQGQAINLNLEF
ncbi:phage tail tape measure protein [Lactococcus taiwanensis]|uniref:phage tail tape measure protein n=1 Tax=Lactococcus taiwanensis TaxID=1151742 RepID=UPI0028A2D811|nr:phage tail tape measure protein [Lactococcus taiwanensis]